MSDECGTTHYNGCACHEARRDAELRKAEQERDEARRLWLEDGESLKGENIELRARVAELERILSDERQCFAKLTEDVAAVERERDGLRDRVAELEGALRWIEMDTRDPSAPNERSNTRARAALAGADDEKTREDDNG